MKSLSKFAIALSWLLLRSILRHIILLVPSLSATTPSSPLATASASVVSYSVTLIYARDTRLTASFLGQPVISRHEKG